MSLEGIAFALVREQETTMKKLIILVIGAVTLALSACNNNKSDNNDVNAATRYSYINGGCWDSTVNQFTQATFCTQSQYVWGANGTCYQAATNQPVQPALCSTVNNGYYMSNGICYNPQAQPVTTTLCSNNGSVVGQCVGPYIYTDASGNRMPTTCAGANCRGYTLIEQATGRQVSCQ
jgi:hypothetical protein